MHKNLIGAYVEFMTPLGYPEGTIGYVTAVEYDQPQIQGYMSVMGRQIIAKVNNHPEVYLTVMHLYKTRHGVWQKEMHEESDWFLHTTVPFSNCRILDLFEIVYLKLETEGRSDDQIST